MGFKKSNLVPPRAPNSISACLGVRVAKGQRYHGPWYHGTMVPWYHGTMVPWYHGTMVPLVPGGNFFLVRFGQILSDLVRVGTLGTKQQSFLCQIWSDLVRFGQIWYPWYLAAIFFWSDLVRFGTLGRIWSDLVPLVPSGILFLVGFGQIWSDLVRFGSYTMHMLSGGLANTASLKKDGPRRT